MVQPAPSAPPASRGPPPQSLPLSNNPETPTPTFSGILVDSRPTTNQSSDQSTATSRMNYHHGPKEPWLTGLCACFKDSKSCCLTCWCPCIAFGRIAEIVDRGSTSCGVSGTLYALLCCLCGYSCLYSCMYRTKLRGLYFLEQKPCLDCCVHCWCESCSLCQEYRELQNRGYDLSIGWHGNVERQRRLAEMRPVVPSAMTR